MEREPAADTPDQERKIKNLELELNDLRQGLAVVTDYYKDLEKVSRKQDAVEAVDKTVARQLVDDDHEFEGIWRFHEEMLEIDPAARVSFDHMYSAFVGYCTRTGREPVERDAFEFVFSRMEHPAPGMDRGEWTGYRLRGDRA
jgi:hypothetical protein